MATTDAQATTLEATTIDDLGLGILFSEKLKISLTINRTSTPCFLSEKNFNSEQDY